MPARSQPTKTNAHNPDLFKPGDKVTIARKMTAQEGWLNSWTDSMSVMVGSSGEVERSDASGVYVKVYGMKTFGYPSSSLELTSQDSSLKPAKKKKRVRVGPGPWDDAPCPHLRWQLMGFFREKLVLVKTADGPTEVRIRCKKCNCEMTLKAQ